ncbi:MAG: hypothetical protein AAFR61_31835, partial [Bacteroidota bacterium]
MKSNYLLFLAALAMLGTACTGPRYASSTEYDDVYYSQADRTEALPSNQVADRPSQADRAPYRQQVDNYNDAYYDEDDFYYSRRLRRFSQANYGSWR